MNVLSQRQFTLLVVCLILVGISAYALLNGGIGRISLEFMLGLGALWVLVDGWFNLLDERIAAGEVSPGDLGALLIMPSWWTMLMGVMAMSGELAGVTVIDPNQQALLVTAVTGFVGLVFKSFGRRLPGATSSAAR